MAFNNHVQAFDMGALNLVVLSVGEQILNVNFTGLAQRYDRTVSDLERAAHFGTLATAMVGAAASVLNVTKPSLSDALVAYRKTGEAATGMSMCAPT